VTATTRGALLVSFTALLLGTGLAAAHELPRLPGPLALKRGADSPGQVTFQHGSHVDAARPACLSCHPERFSMLGASQAGKRPAITHERMTAGRDCGACHGKEAFGLDDCTSCHAE
jgi:c(7)-type cytochrome triheme protein